MAIKHKIVINVSDPNGRKANVLRGADVKLPTRLLKFLFGDFTQVYLLSPGQTVCEFATGTDLLARQVWRIAGKCAKRTVPLAIQRKKKKERRKRENEKKEKKKNENEKEKAPQGTYASPV